MPRKHSDDQDNVIPMTGKRRRVREAAGPGDSTYRATDDGIVHVQGDYERVLCNFDAEVTRRVTKDDGSEPEVVWELEVRSPKGTRIVAVPAHEFARLKWVASVEGAVVWPGPGNRQHLPTAIQVLSEPRSTFTFEHTGWRDVEGELVFLHAGGAIGATGLDVGVELDPALKNFILPEPPEGEALRDAVRGTLQLLELAPTHVTVPALASVFRAVLGPCDFALHIAGTTGTGKSAFAAAAIQSFFGAAMADGTALPGSWSGTANANEKLCWLARDVAFVVDDWLPTKPQAEAEMDRLLRSAGNQGGRARLGAIAYHPRGIVISTGEAVPTTESIVARSVVLSLGKQLRWDLLTSAQERARQGIHAACLASYIDWLRPQLPDVQDGMRQRVIDLRPRFQVPELHSRTPGALANLAVGICTFLDFARDVNALSIAEVADLQRMSMDALVECARAQLEVQLRGRVARLFLHRLAQAIADRKAQLLDARTPKKRLPRVPVVGWRKGGYLHLDPPAAIKAARGESGPPELAIPERTFGDALFGDGLLAQIDTRGERKRFKVRRVLGGRTRHVWVLDAGALP